jgi:hypothetical protein
MPGAQESSHVRPAFEGSFPASRALPRMDMELSFHTAPPLPLLHPPADMEASMPIALRCQCFSMPGSLPPVTFVSRLLWSLPLVIVAAYCLFSFAATLEPMDALCFRVKSAFPALPQGASIEFASYRSGFPLLLQTLLASSVGFTRPYGSSRTAASPLQVAVNCPLSSKTNEQIPSRREALRVVGVENTEDKTNSASAELVVRGNSAEVARVPDGRHDLLVTRISRTCVAISFSPSGRGS